MPNQPPLNPDALEAAARATYEMRNPESWARSWEELDPEEREDEWIKPARTAATAYLTVAQPEVNSVEEVEALPYGSFIVGDSGVAVLKFDGPNYDWVTGSDARYRMDEQMGDLPARVLYRPTEEATNGR